MATLTPKNWTEFQHYKDRNPPWIRLHKSLLDNYEFQCLPVASKALAPMLWLLASDNMDGQIDFNVKKLAFRLRMTEQEVVDAIKPLIDNGFFSLDQNASNVLADRKQLDDPETEAETEALQRQRQSRGDLAAKATRLSADWMPTKEDFKFCVDNRPDLNPGETIARFKDYWIAQPGQKGRKLDWSATWRNWVRNERAPVAKTKAAEADEFFGQIFKNGKDKHHANIIDITPGDADEGNRAALPEVIPDVWEPVQVKVAGDDFV